MSKTIYRDPTPVGEEEEVLKDVHTSPLTAKYTQFIRQKEMGIDVRESIARGIESIEVDTNARVIEFKKDTDKKMSEMNKVVGDNEKNVNEAIINIEKFKEDTNKKVIKVEEKADENKQEIIKTNEAIIELSGETDKRFSELEIPFEKGEFVVGRPTGDFYSLRVKDEVLELPESVSILLVGNKNIIEYEGKKRIETTSENSNFLMFEKRTNELRFLTYQEFLDIKVSKEFVFMGYYYKSTNISTWNIGKNKVHSRAKINSRKANVDIFFDWKKNELKLKSLIDSQVYIESNSFLYNFPKGEITIKFETGQNRYLWFDFDSNQFFTTTVGEYWNRVPNFRECVVGLIDVVNQVASFDINNGVKSSKARIWNHESNKSLLPFPDYDKKHWKITAGTYHVFNENNFVVLNLAEDIIVPFVKATSDTYEKTQYLTFNAYNNIFESATYRDYRNQNHSSNIWYLGHSDIVLKIFVINDEKFSQKNNKVSLFGDSITTFKGHVPTGNTVYYNDENLGGVIKTWWYSLVNGEFNLCVNNSWSGRYVTRKDPSAGRCALDNTNKLGVEGSDPNIIVIYLGTNDFSNNVQIGEFNGTVKEDGFLTFANSYAKMIIDVQTNYPKARIYCCSLGFIYKTNVELTNGNGDRIVDYNNAIRNVASYFNIEVIDLYSLGVNRINYPTYHMNGTHPNREGMELIGNKVRECLLKEIK